jgi:hypothetical protein
MEDAERGKEETDVPVKQEGAGGPEEARPSPKESGPEQPDVETGAEPPRPEQGGAPDADEK